MARMAASVITKVASVMPDIAVAEITAVGIPAANSAMYSPLSGANAGGQAPLTKERILNELTPFARRSNLIGLSWFLQDYVVYWAAIGLVLFAPWITVKVVASIVAGVRLAAFYTLAHDAAHNTLVANRRLNYVLAMLLSVPALQNHRLWLIDHHQQHHPKTNGPQHDFYQPFSKQQFDRLSPLRQHYERFIRAPNGIGFAINFFFPWVLGTRVMPDGATPAKSRRSAWAYFTVLMLYQAAFAAALITVAHLAPPSARLGTASALLLGVALPLFVYALVTGASLYVMHTHRRIPWFAADMPRIGDHAQELCATHMTVPPILARLTFNVFAHSAHHAHPGIPVYHLMRAQRHLDGLLGNRGVVEKLSLSGTIATMRACKLYDFDKHQWLDFDGKPTAPPIDLAKRGA